MTCIVGLEHRGKVYLGGDSAGVGGLRLAIMAEPKVFRRGKFVIGYTTSFRMGQLLQHTLKTPSWDSKWADNLHGFMVSKYIPAVRDCLREGEYLKKAEDVITGGTFLVGYRGSLFVVESDMQVGRVVDGYYAVGCGMDLALGSLHTTSTGPELSPGYRIRLALEAAERFSAGVSGPFTVVSA